MKRRSDVDGVILDINRDFVEKNFAGVIKSIELRANESSDRLILLALSGFETVGFPWWIGDSGSVVKSGKYFTVSGLVLPVRRRPLFYLR